MTNIVSSLIQKDIASPSVAILQTPNSGVVLRNLKFPHSSPSRTHASKLQISCIYTRWFSSDSCRPFRPSPSSPSSVPAQSRKQKKNLACASAPRPQIAPNRGAATSATRAGSLLCWQPDEGRTMEPAGRRCG